MAKKTIEEWRLLITPLEVKDHNGKKMIVMKSSTFDKRYDSYEEALPIAKEVSRANDERKAIMEKQILLNLLKT